MAFDYGDKERNEAEAERCRQEGRDAARAGRSCFGAGGYMPGDLARAHLWRQGFAEVNPEHVDLPEQHREYGRVQLCTGRRHAYTAVVRDKAFAVGLAEADQPGYYDCPKEGTFPSYEAAAARARALNQDNFGLTINDEAAIITSSMRAQNILTRRKGCRA